MFLSACLDLQHHAVDNEGENDHGGAAATAEQAIEAAAERAWEEAQRAASRADDNDDHDDHDDHDHEQQHDEDLDNTVAALQRRNSVLWMLLCLVSGTLLGLVTHKGLP